MTTLALEVPRRESAGVRKDPLPHGTIGRYRAGCRCKACREVFNARRREVYRLKGYGLWSPWTDAGPVRGHVRSLMAGGIGYERIAEQAGVSRATVVRLLYGRPAENVPQARRLRKETAERLLAVRADPALLGDRATVNACGTRRRLQALVARGWSVQRLAGLLGIAPEHARVIAGGGAERVEAGTARRVRDLYERLWDRTPPQATRHERSAATRASRHAERNGWAPPMAWDDDTIDHPAARPGRWKRSQGSRLASADIAELDRAGLTPAGIAERTGASRSAVGRALARHRRRTRTA